MPAWLIFVALLCSFTTGSGALAESKLQGLLDLKPGEWRELPDTAMRSVFPKERETTWGVIGPAGVVIAWGGAAYDTKRNAFVFNGGGHADYGGNEVYAFFLEELKWRRLTEPSAMKQTSSGQWVTSDNTPISVHTYDGLEYLANVDRIFRNGGSEWRSGNSYDHSAWLFDMSSKRWERKAAGGGGLTATAFDPVRGTVYVVNRIGVEEYDPAKDVWVRRARRQADAIPFIAAVDPVNRKLVTDSYTKVGLIVYSIGQDGTLAGGTVSTKGATEWDKRMAALEYDPVRRVLVAWAGERETAYLDLKTMTWRRFKNAASRAGPVKKTDYEASGAIFGRWRYVPKYDVFIGYNAPRRNVWIWKPAAVADGDEAPAPAGPKALLEKLKDGDTVVLPPGVYNEGAIIKANNVHIKADGVKLEDASVEGKGALVITGNNVTIEGLECSGVHVADRNGSCVRLEGRDLVLRRVHFRDSESGLMTWNRDSGTILVEHSRFERLGRPHGIYVGRGETHLIVRNSQFLRSSEEGHEIKSRATRNTIERNVIASLDGVDSRLIDLPEGGENIIRGNVLQKGPASSNEDLIGIGLEGNRAVHKKNSTLIEDNIFILERSHNVLSHHRHVPAPRIERNIVIGGEPAGGTNKWFRNRAEAGLPPYPALPPLPKGK